MALVNVMSMFSQMASPVFVYSVGVQYPLWKTFILVICRALFPKGHLLSWLLWSVFWHPYQVENTWSLGSRSFGNWSQSNSTGLYLPETAGVNLPDTLQEIRMFGKWVEQSKAVSYVTELIDCFARNDRFFWMPILGEENRKKKPMMDRQDVPVDAVWLKQIISIKPEWKVV